MMTECVGEALEPYMAVKASNHRSSPGYELLEPKSIRINYFGIPTPAAQWTFEESIP